MKSFWAELKKRKVVRAGVVYLVAGWLVMQVADVMFPALGIPDWTITLLAAVYIVGFPIAIILSWAYDWGPEGLRRESTEDAADYKAVAVLPFVNMSPDADQEYFSDGLTEELLNALAQLDGLRVSSRTSSFAFKGSSADIHTVAETLGVTYIVEGSVRKAGDRLRITAQLIGADSDVHLWSQVYDRELDDVFAIQDDIAHQVATALQVTLLPQAMPARGTGNVEAYEYFFRGRGYFNQQGQKNQRIAIEMFERAIELDPEFSRAWAGLALAHAYFVFFFDGGPDELTAADEASRKAIELDPDVADGYIARIMIAGARSQYEEADAAFQKAVELDPNNFEAHYQYGRYLFKRGNMKEALAMYGRAGEIDPLDFQTPTLSVSILKSEDEQKARELARKGIRLAEVHLEQNPENARAYVLAAGALQYLGETDKARQFLESALRLDPKSENTQYNAACFFAATGEKEKALDCLERGLQDPDWIENDDDLASLRGHPRYEKLIERLRGASA